MSTPKKGSASIKYGQSAVSNATLEANTRKILASLTADVIHFPKPTPTLAVYATAIDTFSMWCSTANEGTRNDRRARDDARQALTTYTKKLAEYVTMVGNGDPVILGGSGFPLSKYREPTAPLGVPQNLKVANWLSSQMVVSTNAVKNAKTYLFQYTEDPLTDASNWNSVTNSKSKLVLTGLTPGKKYWLRVAAVGVKGQITYSIVTSLICS